MREHSALVFVKLSMNSLVWLANHTNQYNSDLRTHTKRVSYRTSSPLHFGCLAIWSACIHVSVFTALIMFDNIFRLMLIFKLNDHLVSNPPPQSLVRRQTKMDTSILREIFKR